MSKTYAVKEIFYSPQGEGHRAGTMNVFVRLVGCNLQCVNGKALGRPLEGLELDTGWFCDSDFQGGTRMTLDELVDAVRQADRGGCSNVIFTGGEPTLQLDQALIQALRGAYYRVHLETNGTREVPERDYVYVACSPKPGSKVVIKNADEVRVVLVPGQVPDPQGIHAQHYFVSPACRAVPADQMATWKSGPADFDRAAMDYALEWCALNPTWRLSLQQHKVLGVR